MTTDSAAHFDLIVIGSGPAGEKAAVKAAYFGKKVAMVEKEPVLGGAGVNTGTLPSKTLKESALYYSGKYDKGLYGVDRDFERPTSIADFMFRKQRICESMRQEVSLNLERHGVTLYHGTASFLDPHRVKVLGERGESILSASFVIIATGSYPFQPKGIPFSDPRVLDSDQVLELDRIPKSMCIVGAGVIGCEYATIFAAMGTKVHLVNNRDKILGFLDDDISDALVRLMRADGIEILFGKDLVSVQVATDRQAKVTVRLTGDLDLEVETFLFAAGRSGAVRALGLENAGIKEGPRETILVNEKYQTNIPNIYAVGDCIGFPALASTSMDQGRVAVAHIFATGDLDTLPKTFPYGIYTIPEVSAVGLTEAEAKKSGLSYGVGIARYPSLPRGQIMGAKDGFLKLVFEQESRVVRGVHVIGAQASELVHYGLALIDGNKTLDAVIATVFNYPTLHDLYKYAAYDGLAFLRGHKVLK